MRRWRRHRGRRICLNDGSVAGEAAGAVKLAGDGGFVDGGAAEVAGSSAMMAENLSSFVDVSEPIVTGPAADGRL
jgi:hypothetical protein